MEINQYAVTASEMKDLSFLDIDQYVSAGVYQSQKVPVSLVKAYMLSENIEQILLADMQALALAGDLVSLKNYLIDDGSTLYLVMAAGGVGNQIYQYAIDVTSGLFGTFDLVSGVFTPVAGGSQTLSDTLDNGNTSGANDIQFDATQGLLFANASRVREGTTDAGLGGAKGVAQVCSLDYELKWEAGRQYVMNQTGTVIRQSLYNFNIPPTTSDDASLGYQDGSLWTLDNGDTYECIDAASGDWVLRANLVYIKDADDNVFFSGIEQTSNSLTGICTKNTFHQNAIDNVLVLDNLDNVFYQSASNNELGDSSSNNVFGIGASLNTLADGCSNNTFEQNVLNNILGTNCIGNTFKQYANGFTFSGGLQNVTIEAGTTGQNYTTGGYSFIYAQNYPARIFTDGGTNFHSYFDPANDRIVITNLSTLVVSYIGGGAGSGTVTSVGLSMPSAFSVASSPVTTSGTIAVTGAGLSSQYVRGDGSLANFPSSGGGGASVNYYLNGSVTQGTFGGVGMREINKTPIIGTGTDFTIATNGYIQSFITDANDPNQLVIPAGNWNFETYFSASSGGGSPSFYIELHKWDGATLTLIASNSATPEAITGGTTIDLYLTAIAVPQTTLALTDRLAIRIYVNNSSRTITLHTENSHLCQVITTFTTGLTALNGLTEQVQTFAVGTTGTDFAISSASGIHNFNLPTASATNRGALSSADWTAFNALKVENISLQDGGSSIAATTYTLELYAQYAYTINQLKIISASGTCTVAVKINGVDVTGISAVSVSSTIATANASAANTVAVGDKITLVTTSNSALTNLQASLKTTRI